MDQSPEKTNTTSPESSNYYFPVRPHAITLIGQILLLQLATAIVSILLGYPIIAFQTAIEPVVSSVALFAILVLLLLLTGTTLIIVAVLNWAHTVFIIRPKEIIEQRGIWDIREKSFSLGQDESIEVDQTLLGRQFNYGSLRIRREQPAEEIYLNNIPSPHSYENLIRKSSGQESIRGLPGHEKLQ